MKLNEDQLRELAIRAIRELGENATPETVKTFMEREMAVLQSGYSVEPDASSGRAILTAFGMNRPGVVSAIATLLSDAGCDIHDISQKIMQEFFTLIMVIDITNSPKSLREMQEALTNLSLKLNIKIYLQHEDVFRYMHRI